MKPILQNQTSDLINRMFWLHVLRVINNHKSQGQKHLEESSPASTFRVNGRSHEWLRGQPEITLLRILYWPGWKLLFWNTFFLGGEDGSSWGLILENTIVLGLGGGGGQRGMTDGRFLPRLVRGLGLFLWWVPHSLHSAIQLSPLWALGSCRSTGWQ